MLYCFATYLTSPIGMPAAYLPFHLRSETNLQSILEKNISTDH